MKTNFNTLIKTVKEMSIFEIIFFGFVTLFLFIIGSSLSLGIISILIPN